jgi:membrane-associated phospholipid phosphatase
MAATRVEGLWRAAASLARVAVLVLSLITLVLARIGVPLYVLIAAVAVSLLALYAGRSGSSGFGLWASYLVAFVLFAHLRTLADETGVLVKGRYVFRADRWLFGGTFPTEWLQRHLYHPGSVGALEIACVAVYFSYFIVPHLFALILWRRDRESFMQYGLAVLFSVYAGLVVCLAVPTAPPWLAGRFAGGPHVARLLTAVLGRNPEGAGSGSGVAGANPFAAMPSLHMAVTTVVVLALWRRPGLRELGLLYAAAMAFALVYLGEHYVTDELAGVATASLAWVCASRLVRFRAGAKQAARVRISPRPTAELAREPQ